MRESSLGTCRHMPFVVYWLCTSGKHLVDGNMYVNKIIMINIVTIQT